MWGSGWRDLGGSAKPLHNARNVSSDLSEYLVVIVVEVAGPNENLYVNLSFVHYFISTHTLFYSASAPNYDIKLDPQQCISVEES